ncbi:MAG: LytTR family transcriptional regulator DNA-binding domain-containing protein [Reichenbachiella sp.]
MNSIRHLLFWSIIIVLLTILFGRSYGSFSESFYFVSMLLPVIVGTTYYFNYYLVPRFLLPKKHFQFFLYTFYLLIISLNLEMYVLTAAYIILAEYSYENMNPVTSDVFVLTIVLYAIVFCLAFIRLVIFYYADQSQLKSITAELSKKKLSYLSVRENRKNVQLMIEQISYIESLADYVKIHTADSTVITKEKISSLESQLPKNFIRIHRSYIVNRDLLTSYTKENIFIASLKLPISRSYKTIVHSVLKS